MFPNSYTLIKRLNTFGPNTKMIVPVVESWVLMNCIKYFMSGPTLGNRDKLEYKDVEICK